DRVWRRALHQGMVENSAPAPLPNLTLQEGTIAAQLRARPGAGAALSQTNVEVVFLADPKVVDGGHANNAWLQELPDPITKLTWDNAAYVSPTTAQAFGIENGDVLRLSRGDRAIEIAAWILPGQADGSIGLALGWGRTRAGRVGNGRGFDVNPLRRSDTM